MPTFDFFPLFRTAVGFDRMSQLADRAMRMDEQASAYPYNIEKLSEDDYRITMAVAGFTDADLDITVHENALIVKAKKEKPTDEQEQANTTFLHRGIATRSFERRFQLADHIHVTDAKLENGLLHIDLLREVPEALKPRKIEIGTVSGGAQPRVIENQAA